MNSHLSHQAFEHTKKRTTAEIQVMPWDRHKYEAEFNTAQDKEVKDFLRKEPNYLLKSTVKAVVMSSLTLCLFIVVGDLNGRVLIKKKSLNNFVSKLMDIVAFQITHLENGFIQNQTKNMPVSISKNKLKELSKYFVFVPADKGTNNVVI